MTGGAPIDVFRVHGGRIDRARSMFGGDDWIDLSTGIAPYAYPYEAGPAAFTALPDPDTLTELETAARTAFAADDGHDVVAVPGSDLGLRLIGRLFETRRVAVVRPGYGGHVAIWPQDRLIEISANALEDAATTADVILLANPNNPDGRVIEPSRLARIAEMLALRSGWLIVDEAFADVKFTGPPNVSGSPSPSGEGLRFPDTLLRGGEGDGILPNNIIRLRSFGKFFGLPGLRLGFVLAPPEIARTIRAWLGDWPVSGPAIAIGTAAYRDLDWQAAQRNRLTADAARLDALMVMAGLSPCGGTALFRLVETDDGEALFRHFAAKHILTRPFADNAGRLRIGLPGSEDDWARLTGALHEWRG